MKETLANMLSRKLCAEMKGWDPGLLQNLTISPFSSLPPVRTQVLNSCGLMSSSEN